MSLGRYLVEWLELRQLCGGDRRRGAGDSPRVRLTPRRPFGDDGGRGSALDEDCGAPEGLGEGGAVRASPEGGVHYRTAGGLRGGPGAELAVSAEAGLLRVVLLGRALLRGDARQLLAHQVRAQMRHPSEGADRLGEVGLAGPRRPA